MYDPNAPASFSLEDHYLDLILGNAQGDSDLRDAFLHIEERIRASCGLSNEIYGHILIEKAFHPENGLLQPISDYDDERRGLFELFRGAFLYYRNPLSHRSLDHSGSSVAEIAVLLRHLAKLVDQAVDQTVDVGRFVGRHEGNPQHRRLFRLDVDDDDQQELVVLLDTSPIAKAGAGKPTGRFIVVVIDDVDGTQRRLPVEAVEGMSMYGPMNAELMCVTNSTRRDIVATWTSGESGQVTYIFRWTGTHYVDVPFESMGKERKVRSGIATYGTEDIQFSDFNGDGVVEITYTRHTLVEDLVRWGYSVPLSSRHSTATLCRVFRWDAALLRMTVLSEAIVTE